MIKRYEPAKLEPWNLGTLRTASLLRHALIFRTPRGDEGVTNRANQRHISSAEYLLEYEIDFRMDLGMQ